VDKNPASLVKVRLFATLLICKKIGMVDGDSGD